MSKSLAERLNKRVQLYGKVKSTNELKETIYMDAPIKSFWAEVMPQTAKLQNQQADTILTNVTHKIVTRYQKVIAEAYQDKRTKKSMYITYKGHRFDVKFMLNPYFENKSLEFYVEEVLG